MSQSCLSESLVADIFEDESIVYALRRALNWPHLKPKELSCLRRKL